MDKTKWSGPLKTEGVSVRLYQSGDLQVSNPHVQLGLVGLALIGETRPPAIRPRAAALLAADVARELDLTVVPTLSAPVPEMLPLEIFEKPLARMDAERRFILKVGVRVETLNHLPMAWATNQYWLGAKAALIDSSDGSTIWQGSCWINLDPDDKTRQVTNEQLSSANGQSLLVSAMKSATRQCAAAMNSAVATASGAEQYAFNTK